MNDILRCKHNDLMRYGNIISDSDITSDDKTTIARTRIVEYQGNVLLDIMVNGKVTNIIELWKSNDNRETKEKINSKYGKSYIETVM